jgi:hypothetical protein
LPVIPAIKELVMIAMPYDYFLIAWFGLALASTAYVAFDQFNGNPEPTVMKRGFILAD